MRRIVIVGIIVTVILAVKVQPVIAIDGEDERYINGYIDDLGLENISKKDSAGIDMYSLVSELSLGKIEDSKGFMQSLLDCVVGQIKANKRGILEIFAMAIITAIFTNYAKAFNSSEIAKCGVTISVVAISAIMLTSVYMGQSIVKDTVDDCAKFVKLSVPVLSGIIITSTGAQTAIVFGELVLTLISVIFLVFNEVVLRIAGVYASFSIINSLDEDNRLSGLCNLLKRLSAWIIKTVIAVVVGISTIQALVVPGADSTGTSILNKALSSVPGVGNGVNTLTSTMAGACKVVKNSAGVAVMIAIIAIVAVPVLKLAIFLLSYKVLAAVLEPICDKRLTESIKGIAEAIRIHLSIVIATGAIFIIAIAVICIATGNGG